MAFTDTTLSSGIAVKKVHVTELATALTTLATNANKASAVNLSV